MSPEPTAGGVFLKILGTNIVKFVVPVALACGVLYGGYRVYQWRLDKAAMKEHKGEKWGEVGSKDWKRRSGHSSETGEIYIWLANNTILIGSESDVEYRHPRDVIGWGLDTKKLLKDIVKLDKMFGGQKFKSRSEAQQFLNTKITQRRTKPLIASNKAGMIDRKWYDITTAFGR